MKEENKADQELIAEIKALETKNEQSIQNTKLIIPLAVTMLIMLIGMSICRSSRHLTPFPQIKIWLLS